MPRRCSILLVVWLLVTGCAEDEPTTEPSRLMGETSAWTGPATKPDTLVIEGQAEPITVRLFDADGAPFITYLPEDDFVADVDASREGVRFQFFANFGDLEHREAYVSFFFPAPGLGIGNVALLRDYLVARIDRNGWRLTDHDDPEAALPCPWAQDALTFRDEQTEALSTGYACFGTHNSTPFYFLTHVPVAYSEGLGPRLTILLDHFRWRDTEAGLTGR